MHVADDTKAESCKPSLSCHLLVPAMHDVKTLTTTSDF